MDVMAGVFDRGTLAEIEFTFGQTCLVITSKIGECVGRGDGYPVEIGVHPFDDVPCTEARCIPRCLEEYGVGDDDGAARVKQVMEAVRRSQSDQWTSIDDK